MFAVIFEVQPKPERRDDYLSLAKMLRPELNTIDGFLSIERFAGRQRPDWILSLSFWRDEAAIVRWRTHELHHEVQKKGRFEVFRDYRLRVSQVVIDDSPEKPAWRPERRSAYNDLQAHPPTFAAVLEVEPAAKGQADQIDLTAVVGAEVERSTGFLGSERFDSIYVEGKFAYLTSWRDESSVMAWSDRVAAHLASRAVTAGPRATFRLRVTEVERDYGMFSRAEAPQYYAPVERSD